MEVKYFLPLVLEVKVKGPKDRIFESEVDAKIRKQLDDFLIYWQQQDGIEITARFTK